MHYLDQLYFATCKEIFEPYGFKRYRKSFARVKNEMFQVFKIKKYRGGPSCIIPFDAYPLCMKLEEDDYSFIFSGEQMGNFELSQLEASRNWGGWGYDTKSEDSMEQCMEEISRYMRTYLLPFFEKVDTCSVYCNVYISMYRQMDRCRVKSIEEQCGERPSRAPSVRYSPMIYYAGLKCGNMKPAIKGLYDEWVSYGNDYLWSPNRGNFSSKESEEDTRRSLENETAGRKAKISELQQIKDFSVFRPMLEKNEAYARECLKKYIVD